MNLISCSEFYIYLLIVDVSLQKKSEDRWYRTKIPSEFSLLQKQKCLKNISDETGKYEVATSGKSSREQASSSLPVATSAPTGKVAHSVGWVVGLSPY